MCFDALPEYQSGLMASEMASSNQQLAQFQSNAAKKRGTAVASRIRLNAMSVVGTQRAAAAAQNVLIDEGTPLEFQIDTHRLAELDALEAINNARREAWGYHAQSRIYDFEGDVARRVGTSRAFASVQQGIFDNASAAPTEPPGASNDKFGGFHGSTPASGP